MVKNRLSQISILNKYIRRQIENKDYIKWNMQVSVHISHYED
jgi:hypothetical protein